EECVPVARYVDEHNRLLVNAEQAPGQDLAELIERAQAARQHQKRIRAPRHSGKHRPRRRPAASRARRWLAPTPGRLQEKLGRCHYSRRRRHKRCVVHEALFLASDSLQGMAAVSESLFQSNETRAVSRASICIAGGDTLAPKEVPTATPARESP